MILLNQPWSVYERQIERARRREAARRAVAALLWAAGIAVVAFIAGLLFPR